MGRRTITMNSHTNTFHLSLFLIVTAHSKSTIKSQGSYFLVFLPQESC